VEPARGAQFGKGSPGLILADGGLGTHGAKGAFAESGNGTVFRRAERMGWERRRSARFRHGRERGRVGPGAEPGGYGSRVAG